MEADSALSDKRAVSVLADRRFISKDDKFVVATALNNILSQGLYILQSAGLPV